MFERKQTTRPGSVKVILGDDQKLKFNGTRCKTGSISYRKRHLFLYLNTVGGPIKGPIYFVISEV